MGVENSSIVPEGVIRPILAAPNAGWQQPQTGTRPPLVRSRTDRKIAGVAGGLAAYLGVDPLWIRIAFVLISIPGGLGVLLYLLARRLLARASALAGANLTVAAATAALVFAIHPLRVESVGWATERRDVLSGLFFLLTVLMYLKAVDGDEKRRRWRLAASVGLFALALVSKGSVMVLPLALVVLDFYPLRRLGGPWREWIRPPARAVWLEKIPFFVLGVAGGAITYYAQSSNSFSRCSVRSWRAALATPYRTPWSSMFSYAVSSWSRLGS